MDNIQKVIDEAKFEILHTEYGKNPAGFHAEKEKLIEVIPVSKLKSLLEQVAEEAFYDGLKKSIDFTEESMETWWNEQNLTFNED